MFEHQLLQQAEEIKNGFDDESFLSKEPELHMYMDEFVRTVAAIDKAQKFFCGTGHELAQTFKNVIEKLDEKDMPPMFSCWSGQRIGLPFQNCYFEYRYDQEFLRPPSSKDLTDDFHNSSRRALLAGRSDNDPELIIVRILYYIDNLKGWELSPLQYLISLNKPLSSRLEGGPDHPLLKNITEPAERYVATMSILPPEKLPPSVAKSLPRIRSADTEDLMALNLILLLLSCKNVKPKRVYPNRKINAKRIKNGKVPHQAYHVLTINPLNKNGSVTQIGKINNNDGSVRAHLRRGHFKFYTEDKPLFGHPNLTGLFWHEPTLVNPEAAERVDKDYQLKGAA
jgi:hypothetical protein